MEEQQLDLNLRVTAMQLAVEAAKGLFIEEADVDWLVKSAQTIFTYLKGEQQ